MSSNKGTYSIGTDHYASKPPDSNRRIIRQWLRKKSYEEKKEYGERMVKEVEWNKYKT